MLTFKDRPGAENIWSEDLQAQARRGAELGKALCSCPDYFHTLWGALRASQRVSGLEDEALVLADTLSPLLKKGTKVLIGGAADPGQLCLIGRIAGSEGPEITISERCAAPVALLKEFASTKKIPCSILHSDIFNLPEMPQWDVIFLHYTIVHVHPDDRIAFFRKLSALLRPGGQVISVDVIADPPQEALQKEYEHILYVQTLDTLMSSPLRLQVGDNELETMVRRYALERRRRRVFYPSRDDLDNALYGAGFRYIKRSNTGRFRTLRGFDSQTIDSWESSLSVATLS